jgi:hypothetical protein
MTCYVQCVVLCHLKTVSLVLYPKALFICNYVRYVCLASSVGLSRVISK